MIFVDANYFLRLLAPPATPHDLEMANRSAHLFRQARSGRKQMTTSDAVQAEVAYILTSPTSYGLPVERTVRLLRTAVEVRGMKAASKTSWLHALTIWEE